MKTKIYNSLLVLSSLVGYLEWGKGQKMFLFQIEAELFSKLPHDPLAVLHPFVLLPFVGQILLIVAIIRKETRPLLTYLGIGGIGILMALILLVGCLGKNLMIISSTIPFFTISVFTILQLRKTGKEVNSIN